MVGLSVIGQSQINLM